MKNNDIEVIAKGIIEQLDKIATSSYKPWVSPDQLIPVFYSTNKKFTGNNALYLLNQQQSFGFQDNRWILKEEIEEIEGAELKPEAKPFKIPFTISEGGITKVMPLSIYNVSQVNNLSLDKKENQQWNNIEVVEDLLKKTGAKIEHTLSDFAGYDFKQDIILLPTKEQFPSEGAYYNTVLHELLHWTGHKDRLNRFPSKNNQEYAREELVAEIGNMLLQQNLGIKAIQANSQYRMKIKEELQEYLKNDPKEILPAVAKAQKSVDFIMQKVSLKQDLKQDTQKNQCSDLGTEINNIISDFRKKSHQLKNDNLQNNQSVKKGKSR